MATRARSSRDNPATARALYLREQRERPQQFCARTLVNRARTRAKQFGIPFDLTTEWVLERLEAPCPRTGRSFDWENVGSPWRPSLDQRRAGAGYTMENTQVVVWIYNAAKQDWRHEDVVALAVAVLCAEVPGEFASGRTTPDRGDSSRHLDIDRLGDLLRAI